MFWTSFIARISTTEANNVLITNHYSKCQSSVDACISCSALYLSSSILVLCPQPQKKRRDVETLRSKVSSRKCISNLCALISNTESASILQPNLFLGRESWAWHHLQLYIYEFQIWLLTFARSYYFFLICIIIKSFHHCRLSVHEKSEI